MKLPVFRTEFVNAQEFINFWSSQYKYKNEHIYDDNIGKELNEERILSLFEWKNGSKLSEKKFASVRENFINSKIDIPPNPGKVFLSDFLNLPGGAIWRIFWLHCNLPNQFPIYDQHVHRAMAKLKGWNNIEIPCNGKKKVESYISKYLPFWNEFSNFPTKRVDEALWVFGKFLKSGYSRFII